MLELLGLTIEGCVVLGDALGWGLEGYLHWKSRHDRLARKQAKHRGEPVPKRSWWSRLDLVFGLFMVAFTLVLLGWLWWDAVAK